MALSRVFHSINSPVNSLLSFFLSFLFFHSSSSSPQWGAADAEIKVPSGENTELKRSPFKARVDQYIAIHARLTARDFFLACFYPSGPFTCIFSKPSRFFLCWLWLTHGSCVGPQNKIGHPVGCRFQF